MIAQATRGNGPCIAPHVVSGLVDALRSVAAEVAPGLRPYSTDSYLPPHVCDEVAAALRLYDLAQAEPLLFVDASEIAATDSEGGEV